MDEWVRVPAVLSQLEDLELPLLTWGITDGFISHEEVMAVLESAVDADLDSEVFDGPTADEYREYLLDFGLLHVVSGSSPRRYRTRLGEGLRLLRNLRQLFPPSANAPSDWWRSGAPLVADYRLDVRPRRFPKREVPLDQALSALGQFGSLNPAQIAVASSLIGQRDLARFQVDASTAVLGALHDRKSHGVIVGAGTGSGKTLAFYLPAFVAMAGAQRRNGVHTLALYPRKELLRDQARETVIAGRRVATALSKFGLPRLRIGLLYGDTPENNRDSRRLGRENSPWPVVPNGIRCPYFGCPDESCGSAMVWLDEDRDTGSERLVCSTCGASVGSDEIALTRQTMKTSPPDILFTTTEMMSQQATSQGLGRLFGWGARDVPKLLLLDEAHTYSDLHGGQVALMLRRWRNSVRSAGGSEPTFVGLSATLKNAPTFFGSLIGLPESAVDYIRPEAEDLVPQGREYAVVVRSDPLGGASLLSTSIQTAMLAGRLLDSAGKPTGMFGFAGFLFTDDLDVTNRFYDDLRDAEGGQTRWAPGVARRAVLAQLRSPSAQMSTDRYRDGQSWDLVNEIGHSLGSDLRSGALRVGRTSSQDAGVDAASDLIVATASLEVGFNDPRIGLVLQHKAPQEAAAFIQRRGRAGRSPAMRPITIVVLSDYGRDRAAYQAYDELFEPEIVARKIPLGNRYLLKIQATHSLLDWLTRQSGIGGQPFDARATARVPLTPKTDANAKRMAAILERVIDDADTREHLAQHLERALNLDPADVDAILWDEPRSLMLSAVPTLLRRLTAGWKSYDTDAGARPGTVMAEHMTQALFEPLNVPEVTLELPFVGRGRDDAYEQMPVLSALREAVPGNVSKRFGYRRDADRTWLPLPDSSGVVEIDTFASGSLLGTWTVNGRELDVIRPMQIRLQIPPDEIGDGSKGFPLWASEIQHASPLFQAELPRRTYWESVIQSVEFGLHRSANPFEVRRVSIGARAETVSSPPGSRTIRSSTSIEYANAGRPAALGFALKADGCRFAFKIPDATVGIIAHLESPSWRTFAFRTRMAEDPDLDGVANSFQREWLSLVYLTAYALTALKHGGPTRVAAELADGSWANDLPEILEVVYRSAGTTVPGRSDRLVDALQDICTEQIVLDVVNRHAALLKQADVAQVTWDLAVRSYSDTLGAAIRAAILRILPDAQDTDLVVDVTVPDAGHDASVVISETAIGGLGLMEAIQVAYTQDPRQFWSSVTAVAGPSDTEEMDSALRAILADATESPGGVVANAMNAYRSASSAEEADEALTMLIGLWTETWGVPSHLSVAALAARVLRPGSSSETEQDLVFLLRAWAEIEELIGAEIDARVVAYAASTGALPADGNPLISMNADQVFSLLWPQGHIARNQHLQHWQPYAERQLINRLLLYASIHDTAPEVDVSLPDWRDRYADLLGTSGEVVLRAGTREQLGAALLKIPAIPVDQDALRVFGRLQEISRGTDHFDARISVAEGLQ